jgi:hypothetical protein
VRRILMCIIPEKRPQNKSLFAAEDAEGRQGEEVRGIVFLKSKKDFVLVSSESLR